MTIALMEKGRPVPDQTYRTAQQVRLDRVRSVVHKLAKSWFEKDAGHCYSTKCGLILTGVDGAMLTTRDVDCADCEPRRTS